MEPTIAPARGGGGLLRSLPPVVLVLGSISSTQIGAALAKDIFPIIGTRATVFLRVGSAALLLLAVARPRWSGEWRRHIGVVALFGTILAVMNFMFYTALSKVPLAVAVTVEFTGPLGVAVAGSRRARDLVWVVLAAAGILLLSPIEAHDVDPVGIAYALGAGVCWAAYIIVGARMGRKLEGGDALAVAMTIAAALLVPFGAAGVIHGGTPTLIAIGCVVGLLSSALPYSLEVEALRRLPTRVFGIWMSLEPAIAAIAGFLMLGEHLGWPAVVALVLITIASAGSAAWG
ncbi:MAG TPA: EamA family transporter [Gemmatimonadaceae bacterium]|nr:EamA family transporter [Gemmatimonadaceae bacterium]